MKTWAKILLILAAWVVFLMASLGDWAVSLLFMLLLFYYEFRAMKN